jgi:branched-chain amino acid transport system substrate-binding protein
MTASCSPSCDRLWSYLLHKETEIMLSRRSTLLAASALALATGLCFAVPASAADQVVKIGLDLSLTGADAQSALLVKNGAILAIDEANAHKTVPGIRFEAVVLDDGTATAGQYDPAQAAINAKKMGADPAVMAAVGPEMSGAGKAMAPILSAYNLATITPSSTNPDITDPKFAAQYRPKGKAIYFRTVATDAYQGPNMANYFADTLKVKSLYVLDDTGSYGEGIANAFQAQAEKKGIKVLGRDKLDPKAADYSAVLTKIKQLNPDALYYGGVLQAGVKLVKQTYEILPHEMIKGGGDGLVGPEMFTGAGYPAAEGWYGTQASPHVTEDKAMEGWVARYKAAFNLAPDDYAVTGFDASLVIIDAVKRLKAEGKAISRDSVRDAIATGKVKTLQGPVSFDANGDIEDKVISVFRAHENKAVPLDDVNAQFKYVGVAPQS